jgi:hypothetical protein
MKKTTLLDIIACESNEHNFEWHPGYNLANMNLCRSSNITYAPPKTLTLKGRYEAIGDGKAILRSASNAKGIIRLYFWDFSFEITWLCEEVHFKAGVINHREEAIQFIEEFIQLLRQETDLHVFIESLKPITQYDGERNGPWALR